MAEEEGGVQVAVRMRIFNQREKDAGASRIIRMTREEKGSLTFITNPETGDEKEFKFDYSFNSHADDPKVGPYATQDTVFDDLGRPVLMGALEGRNVCLFAYGQTGAGKSFSMLGKSEPVSMQGIIPRTCREIFKVIEKTAGDPLITAQVGIQVVEIYCEQVNDLLADRKTWPPAGHKPRMTKDGFTCDTVLRPCLQYPDIEDAFMFADRNRSVGSHALNPESSRAHTIYQITFEQKRKLSADAKQCETITTRINLVDLAGSERMESAGTSGQMLKEGNAINLSLTALGNTIKALSEGKRPQFRESKLTLLLQGSMTNGKVIMIAAVSPASICFDESVSTLRFAERIKMVKIKAKKNVTLDPVAEIKKEMEEMRQRMQDEINQLRASGGGGGGGGGGGASAEELEALRSALEEQKQHERQLKEDMDKRIKEMAETEAERATRAQDISKSWQKALGGATMQKKEDIKVPHLLNLNEDPRLAESLIYTLDHEKTVVGRTNKEEPPTLEFNGMGIAKNHCVIDWSKDEGVVFLTPGKNARCCVNGVAQTDKVQLKHNCRVWLGNNYAFRFAFPGYESQADPIPEGSAPDYLLAEAEIAQQARKAEGDTGSGEVSALNHQLSEALKKVEQANIISQDLNRECLFSPKIIKNRTTGEDVVVVHVGMPWGSFTWPWDKFNVRLVEMVKQWQSWQYCTANDQAFTLPEKDEENPFIDNEYQLIGEADVWLQSLGNMIDLEVEPLVLSVTGACEGHMKVNIIPLDRNGNEGPWDDDTEDLDPFVESPEELRGKEVQFAVKIPKMTFEVDLKTGGKPRFKDTWVRYKINEKNYNEHFTETEHDPSQTIEAKFSHSRKFKIFVDDSVIALLQKGKITFGVWGKLADAHGPPVLSHSNVVLPEGWKRVTAYMDPEGNLHKEPPTNK